MRDLEEIPPREVRQALAQVAQGCPGGRGCADGPWDAAGQAEDGPGKDRLGTDRLDMERLMRRVWLGWARGGWAEQGWLSQSSAAAAAPAPVPASYPPGHSHTAARAAPRAAVAADRGEGGEPGRTPHIRSLGNGSEPASLQNHPPCPAGSDAQPAGFLPFHRSTRTEMVIAFIPFFPKQLNDTPKEVRGSCSCYHHSNDSGWVSCQNCTDYCFLPTLFSFFLIWS